MIKGKGHSKLTHVVYFLSSLVASEQSVFPLIEVLASKVRAILTKLDSREAQNSTSEAAILKFYLVARLCLRGIIPSYSTLAGLEKPATDFTSFSRPEKCVFFFPTIMHFTILITIIYFPSSELSLLGSKNTTQEQP